MDKLQSHPVADIFPLMDDATFAAFKADVAAHGVLDPIVLYEDKILDGRNRARACEELRIEPRLVDFVGDDPLAFVISHNLHRRHLDETQRAMVGGRIAKLKDGQRPSSIDEGVTRKEAAARLNVGTASIDRAKVVLEKGTPELIAACDAGEIAVSQGAMIAQLKPEAQLHVIRNDPLPPREKSDEPPPPDLTRVQDWLTVKGHIKGLASSSIDAARFVASIDDFWIERIPEIIDQAIAYLEDIQTLISERAHGESIDIQPSHRRNHRRIV